MSEAESTQPTPLPSPITRSGAVRFVLLFLVLTIVFLTAGRYAVNTPPMNWYLFQVARQTSAVLRLLGDGSAVEDTSSYVARTATMRAEMAAWRRGAEPLPGSLGPADPPVSAYEVWTYRAMRLAHDLRVEQQCLALTNATPRADKVSLQGRLDEIQKTMDRLHASSVRGTAPNTTQLAVKGLADLLASSRETANLLSASSANGSKPTGLPDDALAQLEAQVERGRVAQRAFIEGRVTELTTQIQDRLGPLVTFIAQEDPAKPRRFSFHLVPDCGALPSMSIYFAALLAFPATMRKRFAGLLIGVPILYAINIVRLTCLAMIGAWAQNAEIFEFAHQYVWQAVYILLVVGVWLLWVEFIVRPGDAWRAIRTSAA